MRNSFQKTWQDSRDRLIDKVAKFHQKNFKTNKGGKVDTEKEFKKLFDELKESVTEYDQIYRLHKTIDCLYNRKANKKKLKISNIISRYMLLKISFLNFFLFTWSAFGETQDKLSQCEDNLYGYYLAFLLVILIGYPIISLLFFKYIKNGSDIPKLKGLGLPEGSIRGMIAISIIGSFLMALIFGLLSNCISSDKLSTVLTGFGSLSGAVIGFYFGSRSSEQKKGNDLS